MASRHCSQRATNDDNILLENDIDRPDFMGWLYDVTSKQRRWCVLADMLLCVFLRKQDSVPVRVIIVSGSRIIRVLCNTAKHDALDPLRLAHVKITGHHPDVTVSGLLKYQFIIEDCFKKTECVFAADSEALLDKWILMLRLASNLDADIVCDMLNADMSPSTNRCLRKNANWAEKSWSSLKASSDVLPDNSLPRYIPTTDLRKHRLSCQESTFKHPLKENKNELAFSKVIRPNIASVDDDDDGDDDVDDDGCDKVDDTDSEVLRDNPSTVTPVKRSTKLQRQSSFELFKDLLQKKTQVHSVKTKTIDMDNVTHQKRSPHQQQSSCGVQPNEDILSVGLAASFTHQSQMSSYTTSVDSSSSTTSTFAQRIALKASNIRGKLKEHRRKRNIEEDVKSHITSECRISGGLFYKQVLRWSRVWCVVSKGYLYIFRRPEDKMPMVTTLLVDCSLTSIDYSKFTRHYVFRLCQLSVRSLYFQAEEAEFQRWFQILKEETSTYESFQPTMPLYPELFDESTQDVDPDLDSFNRIKCTTPVSCESIEYVLQDESGSVPDTNDNIDAYPKTLSLFSQPIQSMHEKKSSREEKPGFIQDSGMPVVLNTSQKQSGYTCWSLDNYFEQHYLNKFDFSRSCDSLDSWSSDSILADGEVTERSLCDLSPGWENGIFQLYPQLSSSLSLTASKGDTSREDTIFNRHLPGPNNEGLLLVVDDFEINPVPLKAAASEMTPHDCVDGICQKMAPDNNKQPEVRRVRHISLSKDDDKDEIEPPKNNLSKFKRSLSLTKSFRRNRKPYQPHQSNINKSLDQCKQSEKHGYLYQYTIDGSWKRVWCTLTGCHLDVLTSKRDSNVTDSIPVQESTLITELDDGYMGKHYVVKLQHEQSRPRFFAMDTELEMADWLAHFMVARQSPVTMEKGKKQASKELLNQDKFENDREQKPPQGDSSRAECIQCNLTDKREKTQTVLSDNNHSNSEQQKQQQPDIDVTHNQQQTVTEQPDQEIKNTDQNQLEVCVVETQPESKDQHVAEEHSTQLAEQLQQERRKEMTNDQDPFGDTSLNKLVETQQKNVEALKRQQEVINNKADTLTITQEPNKEWKQLVILKQRKISTELKMESLQRALLSGQTKQHKKSKTKLSMNMLKAQSEDCSLGAECSPEIQHWKHQLETLQQEHKDIIREIENCEMKHSWYRNRHTDLRSNVSPSSANLLRESHVEGRNDVRSEIMAPVRSDGSGYQGNVVLTKSKSHSQLSCASVKQNRLQKIGKRFPNLPLLITRRSLMRRVSHVDTEDVNGVGQGSSPSDNSYVIVSPKSLSSQNYAMDIPSCASAVLDDKSTSNRTTPRISTSSQQSSPSSESIMSSVMMTLNKFMTSPQSEHLLLKRSLSSGSQSMPVASALQTDASLIPMDESISPSSEANTSVFTEASLETDSGRGSPIAAEVTEVKLNSHDLARNVQASSSNPIMKSETLANIAAFEDLIHEKLGGLTD